MTNPKLTLGDGSIIKNGRIEGINLEIPSGATITIDGCMVIGNDVTIFGNGDSTMTLVGKIFKNSTITGNTFIINTPDLEPFLDFVKRKAGI